MRAGLFVNRFGDTLFPAPAEVQLVEDSSLSVQRSDALDGAHVVVVAA